MMRPDLALERTEVKTYTRREVELNAGRYVFAAKYANSGITLDVACGTGYGTRILAGTDQAPRDRKPGWLLRRVKDIGKAKSAQLIADHGTSLDVLIAARNGEIGGAVGKKLIDAGRE